MKTKTILQVVVETPEFIKQANLCMDEATKNEFIGYIAGTPLIGALITGTGGARKIRWASEPNQGKSGGVRIIYYYHNQSIPIFLFTVYGKSKKANITQAERGLLKTIINKIVHAYEENFHE